MVYLHPWEIDPEQPRVSAGWRSQFRHYHNLGGTESKFARLLEEFSWGPISNVLSLSWSEQCEQCEVGDGV